MGKSKKHAQKKKKGCRNEIEEFKVKDERALTVIKQHVDESILPLIADATSAREAWEILRRQFGERGSSEVEAIENADEKFEGSVSHTDHSESHSSVQPVDEDEDKEEAARPAVENPAILIADDSVFDTEYGRFEFEVDLEVQVCEKVWDSNLFADENGEKVDEELLESKPNRARTERNQPVTAEETNEQHNTDVLMPMSNYEAFEFAEIYKFFEYITVVDSIVTAVDEIDEGFEDCNFIAEFDRLIEGCMEDAAYEGHCEMPKMFNSMEEVICIENAEEEEELTEHILLKWSLEEIRYYYELMWQQATEDENSMLEHDMMKIEFAAPRVMGIRQSNDEDSWQHAIEELDKRQKEEKKEMKKSRFMKNRTKKKLEEKQKFKTKMKKQIRRIAEFRVWSKKKKKMLHSEQQVKQNFDLFCAYM